MAKVLVLAGGSSNEREVSLRSGGSVKIALETMNHEVGVADPAGQTFDIGQLARDYDVVFSVLHGKGGEDGTMQAALDKTGVPYVGSDAESSDLCFDKWRFRQLAAKAGIRLADGELVTRQTLAKSRLAGRPFVLKPVRGGSTIDTLIIRQGQKASDGQLDDVFSRYREMLIEELVEGSEITVPVLGSEALPVIEIIPPPEGDFDYENKYNGATRELCPPVNIPEDVQEQACRLAEKLHELCGCRDYSRSDMIIDQTGNLVVLEINTLPGMTDQSLFPKAASVAGITMPQLCDRLVNMALERAA